MASSRLVLEQRSLSRQTSGDSYSCWTGRYGGRCGTAQATIGNERWREREEGEGNETAIGKGDVAVKVKTGWEASDREAEAELWSEGRSLNER